MLLFYPIWTKHKSPRNETKRGVHPGTNTRLIASVTPEEETGVAVRQKGGRAEEEPANA